MNYNDAIVIFYESWNDLVASYLCLWLEKKYPLQLYDDVLRRLV